MKSLDLGLLGMLAATTACGGTSQYEPVPGRSQRSDVDVTVPEPRATSSATVAEPAAAPRTDPRAQLLDASFVPPRAPNKFSAVFETTAGSFEVECVREWAPHGADRLHHLFSIGFYEDSALFRVLATPRPFVAQFGIHADPAVSRAWRNANLEPDPVVAPNERGTISFAMAGSNTTRTTQLFINLADNTALDDMGFSPVCKVIDPGMDVVAKFFGEYREQASQQQGRIQDQGNAFLRQEFPDLDYITSARLSVPTDPSR